VSIQAPTPCQRIQPYTLQYPCERPVRSGQFTDRPAKRGATARVMTGDLPTNPWKWLARNRTLIAGVDISAPYYHGGGSRAVWEKSGKLT